MNDIFGRIKKLDFLESVELERNEIKSLDKKGGKTLKIGQRNSHTECPWKVYRRWSGIKHSMTVAGGWVWGDVEIRGTR